MVEARLITDGNQLKELYELRYRVFAGTFPKALYPNGQLKDDFDDEGFHIGCYLKDKLVGAITIILKKNDLLMVERIHDLESDIRNNYAEAMRLIIVDDPDTRGFGIKGIILSELLKKMAEVLKSHEITHVYLQSLEKSQGIYEKMGFKQIKEYKMYEGISNECPMLLVVDEFKLNIFEEAK